MCKGFKQLTQCKISSRARKESSSGSSKSESTKKQGSSLSNNQSKKFSIISFTCCL